MVVIEPGGIETEWGGITADFVEETSGKRPCAAQAARRLLTDRLFDTLISRAVGLPRA